MKLRIVMLATFGAAASLALAAAPARTTADRYVLTQALCIDLGPENGQSLSHAVCRMQVVPVGAIVEVQLPGTPSQWKVDETSLLSGLDAPVRLPSPGRVPRTSEVWVFTFRAERVGSGFIELQEAPRRLTPAGSFRFPITVRP